MEQPSCRPLVSRQPLSFIYKMFYITSIFLRFPTWLLIYAVARWRPHSKWSLQQSIMIRIVKSNLDMVSTTEKPTPRPLLPGKEKERFRVVEPAAAELYKGPLQGPVSPAPIGITWFPRTHAPTEKYSTTAVILHIHGGAFILGDGRSEQAGFLANTLIRHADVSSVYSPQYRLACRPESAPFPAAVQDALTSYLFLTRELGIPATNITLSGDSAGGNIAIALLRYLAEFGQELGIQQPRNALLISPWVSPLNSIAPDVCLQSNPHFSSDFIPPSFLRWGANVYSRVVPPSDPYISSLGHPFRTEVPILVNLGGAEVLEIDGSRWVREMSEVKGNDVKVNYEEAAPHDTLLVGNVIGWAESAQNVAAKVGVFIREKHRAYEQYRTF